MIETVTIITTAVLNWVSISILYECQNLVFSSSSLDLGSSYRGWLCNQGMSERKYGTKDKLILQKLNTTQKKQTTQNTAEQN